MRRRTAEHVLAIGIVLGTAATVCGEDRRSLLISRSDLVRFDIVMGRLTAYAVRGGQTQHHSVCEDGTRESISQSFHGGTSSLTYEVTDPKRQLVLEVAEHRRIRFIHRSQDPANPWVVEFDQPLNGPLRFSIQRGDEEPWRCSATSLWHLLLAESDRCHDELLPILESIRPNWDLSRQVQQIREILVDARGQWAIPGAVELDALVDQLSDPSFAVRQAADRQLRGFGYSVLSYFDGLPRNRLDTEQRVRLSRIRLSLRPVGGDTPGRAASWLANDKSVWLMFLADSDPVKRIVAVEQLGRLCGRQIAFDPRASDEQRTGQLARVRAELANLDR